MMDSKRIQQYAEMLLGEWRLGFERYEDVKNLSEMIQWLQNEPLQVFLLGDDNIVAGATITKKDWIESELTPWLSNVVVAYDQRRQGIGREFLKHVLAHSTEPLYIWCLHGFQSFYESLGFRVVVYKDDLVIMVYSKIVET